MENQLQAEVFGFLTDIMYRNKSINNINNNINTNTNGNVNNTQRSFVVGTGRDYHNNSFTNSNYSLPADYDNNIGDYPQNSARSSVKMLKTERTATNKSRQPYYNNSSSNMNNNNNNMNINTNNNSIFNKKT